jgi:cytochrome c551
VFHRLVNVVVAAVALVAVVAVVFLFAGGGDDRDSDEQSAPASGATVYTERCAACHGANGEGASGPALAEGVLDVDDLIVVITEGRGAMPGFGPTLTDEEIEAVAAYTRESL